MSDALSASIASLQEYLEPGRTGDPGVKREAPSQALAGKTWEEKLQAVRTANAGNGSSSRNSSGGGSTGGNRGQGVPAAPATYQLSMAGRFMAGSGNHVAYLPIGMGMQGVVEEVLRRTLRAEPDRHAVLVVDRPAQALGAAARLRRALDVNVAVFCGGDFLYAFKEEFAGSRVLVFTAGLLLRLVKMGTYALGLASLLVLLDAFAVIRNHPMNTLVREYYWKMEPADQRPRLLGVLSPQLHAKPRPFDKVRQHVRKLQSSMQAQLLLPGPVISGATTTSPGAKDAGRGAGACQLSTETPAGDCFVEVCSDGPGTAGAAGTATGLAGAACLAEVEGALHRHPVFLRGYQPWRGECQLAAALQQHCLALWDVLHEFSLNHFGRLLHFVAPGPSAPDAPGTPGAHPCFLGGGASSTTTSPMQGPRSQQVQPGGSRPAGAAGMAAGSACTAAPGPAAGAAPAYAAASGSTNSSTNGSTVQYAADPLHHDWPLVEVMLRQSIWHTDMLPASGEHGRDPEALALMMHVLECVQALRVCFELGVDPCLRILLPSLHSLHQLLSEGPPAIPPSRLRARIAEVADQSMLVAWLRGIMSRAEFSRYSTLHAGEVGPGGLPAMPPLRKPPKLGCAGAAGSPQQAAQQEDERMVVQQAQQQGQAGGARLALTGAGSSDSALSLHGAPASLAPAPEATSEGAAADAPGNGVLTEPAASYSSGHSVAPQQGSRLGLLVRILQELAAEAQQGAAGEVPAHGIEEPVPREPEAKAGQQPAGLPSQVQPQDTALNGAGEAHSTPPWDEAGSSDSSSHEEQAQQSSRVAGQQGTGETPDQRPPQPLGRNAMTVAVVAASPDSAAALRQTLAAVPELSGAVQPRVLEAACSAWDGQQQEQQQTGGQQEQQPNGEPTALPPCRHQGSCLLTVRVLAREEAESPEGLAKLSGCSRVIWYSSDGIFHAASQDCDSPALTACHALCLAAAAQQQQQQQQQQGPPQEQQQQGHQEGPPREQPEQQPAAAAPGVLECHVLASQEQLEAYQEALKADQTLKAALQLVLLGDAPVEEALANLGHLADMHAGPSAAPLEALACQVLEAVCLGLCGEAPRYVTSEIEPATAAAPGPAVAPAAAVAGSQGGPPAPAAVAPPTAAAAEPGAGQAATEEAPGDGGTVENPPPVEGPSPAPLQDEGEKEGQPLHSLPAGQEQQLAKGGKAPLPQQPRLFRATVALPQATFPALRFHPHPATMPLRPVRGRARADPAQARCSAALRALCALQELGLLARYWPSRLLLARSLLPKAGAAGNGMGPAADLPLFLPGAVPLSQTAYACCPLCGVATSGKAAFLAHLSGWQHRERVRQHAEQGVEVAPWLLPLGAAGSSHGWPREQQGDQEDMPSDGEALQNGSTGQLGGADCMLHDGSQGSPPGARVQEEAGEAAEEEQAEMYSPGPTPFFCPSCGVYCRTAGLLEVHRGSHSHQRRALGLEPGGAYRAPLPGPGRTQPPAPLVTPYFCALCSMYATSEDQLRMHCLGKRHSRNLALHRGPAAAAAAGRGPAPAAPLALPLGLPPPHPGSGTGARYPAALAHGGPPGHRVAVALPVHSQYGALHGAASGHRPVPPAPGMVHHYAAQGLARPPPHLYHAAPMPAGQQGVLQGGTGWGAPGMMPAGGPAHPAMAVGAEAAYQAAVPAVHGVAVQRSPGPAAPGMGPQPPPPPPPFEAAAGMGTAFGSHQAFASGGGSNSRPPSGDAGEGSRTGVEGDMSRFHRCDLCGVVTPSRKHFEYHIQGAKHLRRQAKHLGLPLPPPIGNGRAAGASPSPGPGTPSQAGSPAGDSPQHSLATPSGDSRGASPLPGSRPGTAGAAGTVLEQQQQQRGGHGGETLAPHGPDGGGGTPTQPQQPESLFCPVCGIVATSQLNLEDHYQGRRHQKNVERLQRQATPSTQPPGLPPPHPGAPLAPASSGKALGLERQPSFGLLGLAAAGGEGSLKRAGSNSRLPSGGLLSAGSLPRLPSGSLVSARSLQRMPSGNVYDNFPCVRVGDVVLPSSMDLRAYLDELQHLEDWEGASQIEALPAIAEYGLDVPPGPGDSSETPRPSLGGRGPLAGSTGAQVASPVSANSAAAEAAEGPGAARAAPGGAGGGPHSGGALPPPPAGLSRAGPFASDQCAAAAQSDSRQEPGGTPLAPQVAQLEAASPLPPPPHALAAAGGWQGMASPALAAPAAAAAAGGGGDGVNMGGQSRSSAASTSYSSQGPAATGYRPPSRRPSPSPTGAGRVLQAQYAHPQPQHGQHAQQLGMPLRSRSPAPPPPPAMQQPQLYAQQYARYGQSGSVQTAVQYRPSPPATPPAQPYWAGQQPAVDPAAAAAAGMAHVGFMPAPGLAQMPAGQGSYGMVPVQPMIPVMHPAQYGMQYGHPGMAVPVMQFGGHPMAGGVQMQAPVLEQQGGGGWVSVQQHQYWAEAQQMGHQMQQAQQLQQNAQRFGRG
ncbi:hypothetical protein N2152v2_002395 [Parachlorella kessleri]